MRVEIKQKGKRLEVDSKACNEDENYLKPLSDLEYSNHINETLNALFTSIKPEL